MKKAFCLLPFKSGYFALSVETVSGTKDSMMESQANTHEKNRAVLSILALLGVAVVVAVAVGWVYRSRCPHSSHTGTVDGCILPGGVVSCFRMLLSFGAQC